MAVNLGIRNAFILAGGRGERLKAIAAGTQKVMIASGTVMVGPSEEKPNLWWNIELMRRNGVKRIVLGVGHMAEQVEQYFGDGKKFGVEIIYSREKEPLGTAGALKNAQKHLGNGTFFMMNGDELKDFDLGAMLALHRAEKAIATIALVEVGDTGSFGIAELAGNRIKRFVEKPARENAPSNLANSGIYILETEVFGLAPPNRNVSIERELFPKIAAMGKLFGFRAKGQWFPTDTMEKHERARRKWKGFVLNKEQQ